MIIRYGMPETETEDSEHDSIPELEDASDFEAAESPTGRTLVVRRSLNVEIKGEESDLEQRENIFHTRALVQDKVVSLIIDSGSCVNVAIKLMVVKLGLATLRHPTPYMLQWLYNSGEVKVTRQVRVPFSIGRYKDEVVCDVVLH